MYHHHHYYYYHYYCYISQVSGPSLLEESKSNFRTQLFPFENIRFRFISQVSQKLTAFLAIVVVMYNESNFQKIADGQK